MISIRKLRAADTKAVARLISATCVKYNASAGTARATRDYIHELRITTAHLKRLKKTSGRTCMRAIQVYTVIVV